MFKIKSWARSLGTGCLLASLGTGVLTLCAGDAPAGGGGKFPFTIYDEKGGPNNHYAASGWMGDTRDLKADDGCTNNPHSGKTCLRFEYTATDEWTGVVWQDPANDWGDLPGGWNLTGAKAITFWARGEKGGEIVRFKFGVLGPDKKYPDSASGETSDLKLTAEWKRYAIDLAGKDLAHIKTGFVWTLRGQGQPVIFYLDDIRVE